MFKRYLILPWLLIVSALAFAACGSSDNDESQIEDAVVTSATSTDPAVCKKLATQQFMEQTTQSEGSKAVKACEEEASNDEGADTFSSFVIRHSSFPIIFASPQSMSNTSP